VKISKAVDLIAVSSPVMAKELLEIVTETPVFKLINELRS
jgi:hypothetical protein